MFWKNLLFNLQAFLVLIPGIGQQAPLQKIGELPEDIHESSGLARLPTGDFVQINDSGNPPCLFFTDRHGKLVNWECPDFLENTDWEDLAYGNDYLYVGDFGNNDNMRQDLKVYRLKLTPDQKIESAGIIHFSYADQNAFPPHESEQNYDLEAMFYAHDSLFLFTKNRTKPFTGYTYMYALPAHPGTYSLERKDSLRLGIAGKHQNWITGADLNPSQNIMLLLGYDQAWMIYNFKGTNFLKGDLSALQFDAISQKESLCFDGDSSVIISDERTKLIKGGNVYYLKLDQRFFKPTEEKIVELISDKSFDNEISARISGSAELPILWEIYTVTGDRPLFGKIDTSPPDNGPHLLQINTTSLPPGGYVLSIIVAGRPYAYKLKKRIK